VQCAALGRSRLQRHDDDAAAPRTARRLLRRTWRGVAVAMTLGAAFSRDGFVTLDGVVGEVTVRAMLRCLSRLGVTGAGTRTLLSHAWCAALAHRLVACDRLRELLPADAVAVQCTLFDKSPDCNWSVPMHRDLHLPVAERIDHPDLQGWSWKEGSWFVRAPTSVLQQTVALRVQLDEGVPGGGGLAVAPGTHRTLQARAAVRTECVVQLGGVLAMSPLLLHGSSKAQRPVRRRVLHFLFAPPRLPLGLRWTLAR
jgi:hypothetical protein